MVRDAPVYNAVKDVQKGFAHVYRTVDVKKFLLSVWRILPFFMQRIASAILRPHFQVAVGAVILNENGELLLCRHSYRRLHAWGLPGGDLKFREDPIDGIKREVLEETGFKVNHVELLMAENSSTIHQVSLTYLCTGEHENFIPNDEVLEIRYFNTSQLPDFFDEHKQTIDESLRIIAGKKELHP
jgi:8-oxo-dGTP diphosphatase